MDPITRQERRGERPADRSTLEWKHTVLAEEERALEKEFRRTQLAKTFDEWMDAKKRRERIEKRLNEFRGLTKE